MCMQKPQPPRPLFSHMPYIQWELVISPCPYHDMFIAKLLGDKYISMKNIPELGVLKIDFKSGIFCICHKDLNVN